MTDYIRKAIELADEWSLVHIYDGEDWGQEFGDNSGVPTQQVLIQEPTKFQSSLDALAAQLVRQVDAVDGIIFNSLGNMECAVSNVGDVTDYSSVRGYDRTMNTIKAIVDSGVLKCS